MARKKAKTGLIVGLSILGVIGVLAGASAIITKGFTKSLKDGITGTETVMKLKAVSMTQEGVVTFSNGAEEDEVTISVNVEGSCVINEETEKLTKLTLGNNESASNISKEDLELDLTNSGMEAKDILSFENSTVALGAAKGSFLGLTLNVEYDEDAATSAYTEVAYFDAIRINYVAPAERIILQTNSSENKHSASFHKQIITGRTVSEDIKLTALEKNFTLSENNMSFGSFSVSNAKDNRVTIESIELLNTSKANSNKHCWFIQA